MQCLNIHTLFKALKCTVIFYVVYEVYLIMYECDISVHG
jgi:hypothetical protein